jgi:hypothetical protein
MLMSLPYPLLILLSEHWLTVSCLPVALWKVLCSLLFVVHRIVKPCHGFLLVC